MTDFIDRRFTRLVVLKFTGFRQGVRGRYEFLCRCDCGVEVLRSYVSLQTGGAKSCGCLYKEQRTKHGQSKTKLYAVWAAMHDRCKRPTVRNYPNYGGRGIKVCERWSEFVAFRDDMGPRPPGGTLERNDTDGNYEPSNCRWATNKEQQSNRRDNVRITLLGRTQTATQWCAELGYSNHRLYYYRSRGHKAEDVLMKHIAQIATTAAQSPTTLGKQS